MSHIASEGPGRTFVRYNTTAFGLLVLPQENFLVLSGAQALVLLYWVVMTASWQPKNFAFPFGLYVCVWVHTLYINDFKNWSFILQ